MPPPNLSAQAPMHLGNENVSRNRTAPGPQRIQFQGFDK